MKVDSLPAGPLPFDEAIEYFKHLLPMKEQEFYAIADEAKAMAFTVSALAQEEAIADAFRLVQRAIEQGQSLGEFKKEFERRMAAHGVGLTDSYIETVYRTNIQRAYNVGRYRQMTMPGVVKARPYWQYDAVNDSRTRPTHRAMDGRVYPADDPVWDTWYPPNGFRCRCRVNTLSERQVKRLGLEVRKGPVNETIEIPGKGPVPLEPDSGFAHNPGRAMWGWVSEREKQYLAEQERWEPVWPDKEEYANRNVIIKPHKVEEIGSELLKNLEKAGVIQLEDVFGHKVTITRDGLVEHLKRHESADVRQRLRYLDLLEPTLKKPGLVVLRAYKRAKSGKIRFRRNYIAGYELKEKKKRFVIAVAQFDGGVWTGWTFFTSTKTPAPYSARWGYILYQEKED